MGNLDKAEEVLQNAELVDVGDPWFKIIRLPKNIYVIVEDGHVEEVCSFLIIGSEKAILLDTGMGVSNIAEVVNKLTDLEIIVINTHSHYDHIGDNWRFPKIHIYADAYAVDKLTEGFPHEQLLGGYEEKSFTKPYPPGFDPSKYEIKPTERSKITQLQDGDIIDLGGRQLEVLHTPGHSQDGIVLLDREGRVMFTGDTFCEWLLAFMGPDTPGFGYSDLKAFEQSMKKLATLVPDLDYLCPSHVTPLADPEILIDAAKALEEVNQGKAVYSEELEYGEIRRVYKCDGFWIWI